MKMVQTDAEIIRPVTTVFCMLVQESGRSERESELKNVHHTDTHTYTVTKASESKSSAKKADGKRV